ncbi:MAG: TrkA family potassium uptake protein [Muribaculaceae bacterium]|nr:TrkA family potassium uptake protein [Muribaculaceae bacterium]
MRYLIIGLGIYGSNLARDLTDMGHEVIGADRSGVLVDTIKDYISTAYVIDSTDESALAALPLNVVDLVIVAIGENFGANIKTVALLKKLGVKHIYARAADPVHRSILEGLKIDRILTPEQRAARDLSQEMALGHQAEVMKVDAESYVICFQLPDIFYGIAYSRLNLQKDFGLKLIGASRPIHTRNILGIGTESLQPLDISREDEKVAEGDVAIVYGTRRAYTKLLKHLG